MKNNWAHIFEILKNALYLIKAIIHPKIYIYLINTSPRSQGLNTIPTVSITYLNRIQFIFSVGCNII